MGLILLDAPPIRPVIWYPDLTREDREWVRAHLALAEAYVFVALDDPTCSPAIPPDYED